MDDENEKIREEQIKAQKEKRLQKQKLEEEQKIKQKQEEKQRKKDEIKKQKEICELKKLQDKKNKAEQKNKEKIQKLQEKQKQDTQNEIIRQNKLYREKKIKEQKMAKKQEKQKQKQKQIQKQNQIKQRQERISSKAKNKIIDFSFEEDEAKRIYLASSYNQKRQDIENKKKNQKIKRLRKKLKISSFIFLVLVFVLLVYYCLNSSKFAISKINVFGNDYVSYEDIVSFSQVKGKNIFKINDFEVEDNIRYNAMVKYVNLKRKFPDTLEIYIEERTPKFYLKTQTNKTYIIDEQGYIIDYLVNSALHNSSKQIELENLTQISGLKSYEVGQRLSSQDLNKLETIYKILNILETNNASFKIDSFDFDQNELSIQINEEQKKVLLGEDSNISNKMIKLLAILEETKGKKGTIYLEDEKYKSFFREE